MHDRIRIRIRQVIVLPAAVGRVAVRARFPDPGQFPGRDGIANFPATRCVGVNAIRTGSVVQKRDGFCKDNAVILEPA